HGQVVAFGVGQVEEALTPRCVRRGGVRRQAHGDGTRAEAIHVGDIKDHPAPPGAWTNDGPRDQVQVARAGVQAGEGGLLAAVADGEAQGPIEADRAGYVVGDQADRADALDRWRTFMIVWHPR